MVSFISLSLCKNKKSTFKTGILRADNVISFRYSGAQGIIAKRRRMMSNFPRVYSNFLFVGVMRQLLSLPLSLRDSIRDSYVGHVT